MKNSIISNSKKALLVALFFFAFVGTKCYSQAAKKTVSLAVQHFKLMKEYSYLTILTKSKGKNGFEPIAVSNLTIYTTDTTGVAPDLKIGTISTNKDGKAKFVLPSKFNSESASFVVKVVNNKMYNDTDETVSVKNGTIEASIEKTDSTYTLKARLTDDKNKPIADEDLKAGLKRLFGTLALDDKDSYTTDADGAIEISFANKGLTGIDGNLNFQVALVDNEKYGTIVASIIKKMGEPITDKSTFNERTMWSPPTKTPLFLLIIPNVILIGIWSILTVLLFNLIKIYKSKK